MKSNFLFRLYRTDKLLFTAVAIYFLGIVYGWRLDREEFPFLLYGMYSLPEKAKETYAVNLIEIDGKEIINNELLSPKRELITSTLNHTIPLMDTILTEKQKQTFKSWLWRYIHGREDSMKVFRMEAGFDGEGKMHLNRKELVYSYAE